MKLELLLMAVILCSFASAMEVNDYIATATAHYDNYSIVVGENSSEAEVSSATDLSYATGIMWFYDSESDVADLTSNLILIGSPDENQKTAELGDASKGSIYILKGNLFIAGNESFNVNKINALISSSTNSTENQTQTETNQTANIDNSSQQNNLSSSDNNGNSNSDVANENTNTVTQQNTQSSSSGEIIFSNVLIASVLGVIALIIIIIFVISFLRPPKS